MNLKSKNLKNIIGQYAPHALSALIQRIPKIKKVAFLYFNVPPTIQKRAKLSASEIKLIKKATIARGQHSFLFSETLLDVSIKAGVLPKGILKALNYHQIHSNKKLWMDKKDLLNGKLISQCFNDSFILPLAFSSKIETKKGQYMHLPLIDFHVTKTPIGLKNVLEVSKILFGPSFIILASDVSFHGIGLNLVSDLELKKILAKAVLFSPIVDYSYVAHQQIEGECAIRITKKHPTGFPPKVISLSFDGKIRTGKF